MTGSSPERSPVVRAADADRVAAVARLQAAVGEGRLDLDEFGQRASAAHAAVTTAELDALLADLPREPPAGIAGVRPPEKLSTVFGDVRLSGPSVPRQVGTVFGDVRIDLRALRTDVPRLELELHSVFGDVDVIVGEGVDAELRGRTIFGDRRVELAPVPRPAGTPLVVVHARTVFGNLRLRSLGPGEFPSRWRTVLGRLTERRLPPVG